MEEVISRDQEFAEFVLERVEANGEYVTLTFNDGLCTGYSKADSLAPDFTPEAGQTVRFYGKNAGSLGGSRRGLMIDGTVLEYRTEEEDRAHHRLQRLKSEVERQREFERNEKGFEDRLDALPVPFRARIHYFLNHNRNFYWEFLPYELMVCGDAVELANAAKAKCIGPESAKEWIEDFHRLGYEKQREAVPGLSDGHSGNSFDFVVRLAHVFVADGMVELEHGALCPLVGCTAYGCRLAENDPA